MTLNGEDWIEQSSKSRAGTRESKESVRSESRKQRRGPGGLKPTPNDLTARKHESKRAPFGTWSRTEVRSSNGAEGETRQFRTFFDASEDTDPAKIRWVGR